jgi:hypothetical protein
VGDWNYRIVAEQSISSFLSFRLDYRNGLYEHGWGESSDFGNLYNIWVKGHGIDIGPRFYLHKRKTGGPWGFYLGVNFVYRRLTESFSGYLVDDANYMADPKSFPYADIQTKGNGFGIGTGCGWKFVWKYLFFEPGFSFEYLQEKYGSSQDHQIISNYYDASNLLTLNFHFNVGLIYSKHAKPVNDNDPTDHPSINFGTSVHHALVTVYCPVSDLSPTSSPNVLVNDSVVGKFAPGYSYSLVVTRENTEMKIGVSGMSSVPLRFVPKIGHHYFLRILPPKNTYVNIPLFQFVNPEVGEYDLKRIQENKPKRDLKE